MPSKYIWEFKDIIEMEPEVWWKIKRAYTGDIEPTYGMLCLEENLASSDPLYLTDCLISTLDIGIQVLTLK